MAEQKKNVTEEVKAEEIQQEQQAPVDQAAPEGAPQQEPNQEAPVKESWLTKAGQAVKAGAKKVVDTGKKVLPFVAGGVAIAAVAYTKGALDQVTAQNQTTPELPDNKEPEEVEEIKVTEIPAEEESQEEPNESSDNSEEE